MEDHELPASDATSPASTPPSPMGDVAPSTPRVRRGIALGIAGGALAVVAVAGLTAWGVSAAVAAPHATTVQTVAHASPASAKTGAAAKGTGAARRAHGVVGAITAINGDTWTIHAASGRTVTVAVNGRTTYGTKKKPATASDFTVGQRIAVLGARKGDAVTATHVIALPARSHVAQPSGSPAA